MLFQTVIRDAKKAGLAEKQSRVVQKILSSGRFVLDNNSTKAMTHLSIMKPSRILAAKDYLRLPFDSIWVERSDSARTEAIREIGLEAETSPTDRTGFLIWNDPASSDHIFVWNLYSEPSDFQERWGRGRFSWAPLAARINTSMENLDQTTVAEILGELVEGIKNEGSFLWEIRNQPNELEAFAKLTAACDLVTCPLIERMPMARMMVKRLYDEDNESIQRQVMMSIRTRVNCALAAILLLNCKSGFERDEVQPEQSGAAKLNVGNKYKRASNQKYTILRMRVPKGAMGTGDGTEKKRAAHWVMGHPKIRKTGIFWWSPHIRGVGAAPEAPRTRLVKS